MAFGISRKELHRWKHEIDLGNIAFLTHFWLDDRFPNSHCVTKVGCKDTNKLAQWGTRYGLKREWIHHYKQYPHFDLMGNIQMSILKEYGLEDHIERFKIQKT
ncbi:hypothetical protein [Metabacillus halosaccharovorans]|uniref:hypothetical protein n=1 Tax=Metabacillus halosaccharovorans TaxID=930124 RepID=UPI001C1FB64A|nr:hypothetical protein [Metabacillus halosaccharovorans]MBU7592322.1 hypothetical protein [Metabacillus halosaccharovorans]